MVECLRNSFLWYAIFFMTSEQTHRNRTAQIVPVRKAISRSNRLRWWLVDRLFLEFATSPQRYNWLLILLVQEHPLPFKSTQGLKKKTSNDISFVPAWHGAYLRSGNFTSNQTLGGRDRVTEEFASWSLPLYFAHGVNFCSGNSP